MSKRLVDTIPAPSNDWGVSIERMVPIRLSPPANIDFRTAFVFSNVDDCATIAHLARYAQLPLHEVIECVLRLVDAGSLTFSDNRRVTSSSGIVPAFGADDETPRSAKVGAA